jgi:putative nucleotidyltransferase with HDIG domain
MANMSEQNDSLSAYAGRWVAFVGEDIAGVGHTAESAQQMAQRNRPKERSRPYFMEPASGIRLALPEMLGELRPFLTQHPHAVYLVGGAVRDAVRGEASHDLDFVVAADAIRLTFRVADRLGVPAYVLDKERDIGRVVLADTTLDFARMRGTLDDDLRERDFTVNAIALPATAQFYESIIDPCGGLEDLKARRLQLTHPESLTADPVRALRAVRQSLELNLAMTAELETAVSAAAPLLFQSASERLREEFGKLIEGPQPAAGVALLHQLGLLTILLPDMAALDGLEQSPPHHEPVLDHTFSVLRWLVRIESVILYDTDLADLTGLANLSGLLPLRDHLQAHLGRPVDGGLTGRGVLRLAALLHDVGKGETRTEENGRIRFITHEVVGAEMAARRLRRLTFSKEAVQHIKRIVRNHMRPLSLVQAQGANPSRRAVYRFFKESGAAGVDVCLHALADHLATHDGPGEQPAWERLLGLTSSLLNHYFNQKETAVSPPPLLSGHDVIEALQIKPGPEIGRLLRLVEEAQATGQITTREQALVFVKRAAG